jgi:hypothetical protein
MTMWKPTLKGGRGSAERASDHAVREQRLESIRDAVEQFTYDLGLLIAGHDVSSESSDRELTSQLQRQFRPFLDAGDAMRPDFGAFGDLRIEGDLLQSSRPVLATLEFDDRCAREMADGRVVPARGRRLRATLEVAVDPVHIVACHIADVSDRRG